MQSVIYTLSFDMQFKSAKSQLTGFSRNKDVLDTDIELNGQKIMMVDLHVGHSLSKKTLDSDMPTQEIYIADFNVGSAIFFLANFN